MKFGHLGLGTWFSALMSLCCFKSNPDGSKMKTFSTTLQLFQPQILTGLLQLILSPFIVGIILGSDRVPIDYSQIDIFS